MYDKFLLNSVKENDELQTQQNMILGKVVLDTLCSLTKKIEAEDYSSDFLPIIREVREGYVAVYKNRQPKIDYASISTEYIEK